MAGIIRHGTGENMVVKRKPFLASLRCDRRGSITLGNAEEGRATAFETSIEAPGDMKRWRGVVEKLVAV